MCKVNTKNSDSQEKVSFSFPHAISGKDIRVDFTAPDISSNGGLVVAGSLMDTIAGRIGNLIPDFRNQDLIRHTYAEMVCQRVAQILCGYEDANDCDRLRHDSALKMSVGRAPEDDDLCSQPTMTRLENHIDSKTLYKIGKLFLKEYADSFAKAPKHIIIDADDTNADTYGAQELSLFNDYYGEYCYMPLQLFDGLTGRLILAILRPGRTNKSLNVSRILERVFEYLHKRWPQTVIELRGNSHFCSHEFMDWAKGKWYVRFTTGLAGNSALFKMVEKKVRMAENKFRKLDEERNSVKESHKESKDGNSRRSVVLVRRYYKFYYKAKSWKYPQRVIVKIEVSSMGTNIRFVVTSNKNNTAETVYRHYSKRGEMELWIKDLKYFKADRMSCNSYKANYFRVFLYAAAYTVAYNMKHIQFRDTEVESFTMYSLIKRVMLSAVFIKERKTYVQISFSPHHRHREALQMALQRRLSASHQRLKK